MYKGGHYRVFDQEEDVVMRIHSIYVATEGEGIYIGTPQVFVRFKGCSWHCRNCDSDYTWEFGTESQRISLEQVLTKIQEISFGGKIKRVSITGGDPLADENIADATMLAGELKTRGYFVSIEASGNALRHRLFDIVDFISIDFKTPSSGNETPLATLATLTRQYLGKFQVKSVIEDEIDFNAVYQAYYVLRAELPNVDFPWCLTPCYKTNESFPQRRFQNVLRWNEKAGGPFRVIGQQHKWVYGPHEKDV